jgi:hypothetical protein
VFKHTNFQLLGTTAMGVPVYGVGCATYGEVDTKDVKTMVDLVLSFPDSAERRDGFLILYFNTLGATNAINVFQAARSDPRFNKLTDAILLSAVLAKKVSKSAASAKLLSSMPGEKKISQFTIIAESIDDLQSEIENVLTGRGSAVDVLTGRGFPASCWENCAAFFNI